MKINETLELLDHIKNAPTFMGGDSRYTNVSNSSELWLEDIKTIEKELKVLEALRKNIYIYISSTPNIYVGKKYMIKVIYPSYEHLYTCGFVNYETKEILKNFNEGD